eukprot:3216199-Prorocentrum_lima.AAC.1
MNAPAEPFAMWDAKVSHFLLPLTKLPRHASGTSRAVVRSEDGDTEAIYWMDEVFCKEKPTPLTPANK